MKCELHVFNVTENRPLPCSRDRDVVRPVTTKHVTSKGRILDGWNGRVGMCKECFVKSADVDHPFYFRFDAGKVIAGEPANSGWLKRWYELHPKKPVG